MSVRFLVRSLGAALIAGLILAPAARAQQPPSAAAVALASQILEIKGGMNAFDPALDGVLEHHKSTFLQMNPATGRVLTDVETKLRAESAPKKQELHTEVATAYASQFSEQELKDLLAFYKTPLGKKVIENEPKAGEEVVRRVQIWIDKYADQVSARMRAELKSKGFTEF
jgi:hypothetical protein